MGEAWEHVGPKLEPPLDIQKTLRLSTSHRTTSNLIWGRAQRRSWTVAVACLLMITIPPALTIGYWIALQHFDGSLSAMVSSLQSAGLVSFCKQFAPAASVRATTGYTTWVLFQALLYTILPGKSAGQLTPAGHLLEYSTNGLLAWQVTVAVAVIATLTGTIDPAILADNWEGMIVPLNVYGFVLSAIAYVKAYYAPTHAEDRKFSGSVMYDFFMGIEFNPRFGRDWDWKLFHNGRPGMIGWTLIDLSFTALQYRKFGYITNSIIIVDILHALYVVDFFMNESWYLRTIDICHDHFGFYFAWGSAAFLPTMYTLQVQYLALHPVQLSTFTATAILFLGLGGYALFRSVNHQKDLVRRTKGECTIWGAKANFLRCSFKTADGLTHESLLLLSGWWGLARHANYVGDLMLSSAMCAVCGFHHLLPWFYAIYMTTILVHRCYRDEQRCSAKYGDKWKQYCKLVKYRLIPGVW